MNGNYIYDLKDPIDPQMPVTQSYADSHYLGGGGLTIDNDTIQTLLGVTQVKKVYPYLIVGDGPGNPDAVLQTDDGLNFFQ